MRTTTQRTCQILKNCRDDLSAFASDPLIVAGVAYSVAHRLEQLIAELETSDGY